MAAPEPHGARRNLRRRRVLTRAAPLIAVAVIAFAIGLFMALRPGQDERRLVTQYVTAWTHADFGRMYGLLDAASRRHASESGFAALLQQAANTATVVSMRVLHVGGRSGDTIPVRITIRTKLWQTLRETVPVPLSGSGSGARVHFAATLVFPGLRPGERLTRRIILPARAALLASNGTPLAEGPGRTSPIPDVAGEIDGILGPIPADQTATYAALGYPPRTQVGLDGLERVFQDRLAGTLGGRLLAGRRVLASAAPAQAPAVMTTIDPPIERAATAAMAGRYAGIAVMNPRTGALLALSGVAFSALQPPGSTMKIVTATGALQAGIVKLGTQFPVQSSASIEGFSLSNAGGESCGGTFLNAFAVSCNSVFAPLGARLGARRLVAIAERFGFNQPPSIPGASESSIPPANAIGDSLAVASSAIGQGKVQTSALGMTDVAATIAMGGRRPIPTLLADQPPHFVRVTSRRVARLVQRMMIAVVQFGTGTSAQIPGVTVAGKTGTAELRNTSNPNDPNASNPKNTDSWFVGYAPVGHPRFVVGALFPAQGAGAQTAAPAVHDVLAAALRTH